MFGKLLDFLDKILTFFEEWTLFVTVMAALVALFVNVVLRYGFNYSLAWSEELVREVIIYTTFIGCSAAVKNRSLIKIDASVQLIPKLKIPLTYFSNFVTIIFAAMMIYYGWMMVVLQHPEIEGIWGRMITNHAHGIRIEIRCSRGQFTPAMVENLGLNINIRQMAGRQDQVQFWLQKMDQCDAMQLEKLIRESIDQLRRQGAS